MMWYRRTQFRRHVVTSEGCHHNRCEDAGHDGKKHTTAARWSQRAAKDDDRQHGAQGELQPDRLMDEGQGRDDAAVGRAARQADRPRTRERQRYGEQRQRGGTEQVGAGGIGCERDSKGQQRNQHRDHQPAL